MIPSKSTAKMPLEPLGNQPLDHGNPGLSDSEAASALNAHWENAKTHPSQQMQVSINKANFIVAI
jgi:hypothetical protein